MRDVKTRYWLVASLLVIGFAFNSLGQVEPRYAELPNFHQVNSQLYSGGQPKVGGLPRLKALGIKTIVNLRGKNTRTQIEGAEARELELSYYSISLPEFSGPKEEDVQRVLALSMLTRTNRFSFTAGVARIAQERSSPLIASLTTVGMRPTRRRKPGP